MTRQGKGQRPGVNSTRGLRRIKRQQPLAIDAGPPDALVVDGAEEDVEARELMAQAVGYMQVQVRQTYGPAADVETQAIEVTGPDIAVGFLTVRSPRGARQMVLRVELRGDKAIFTPSDRLRPARAVRAEVNVLRTNQTWDVIIVDIPPGLTSDAEIRLCAERVVDALLTQRGDMDVKAIHCDYWRFI